LPSWGSLLRELESFSAFSAQPWQFVPLVLLIVAVSCFHLALAREEFSA
jgi:ABC-type dipeptide/oligopeptide/nickel transport system permease subunit